MKPWESPPAIVRDITDEETQLVTEAKDALSNCHFTVGRCAQQWVERYAQGRTDAAFGELIGMSPDMVQKCRRVHELFGELSQSLELSWSHYNVAITWEDADECLNWADDNGASVAEMKAWRRAKNGEDLTVDEDETNDGSRKSVEEPEETPRAPVAGSRNRESNQADAGKEPATSSGADSPAESEPAPPQDDRPLLQQLMEILTKIEATADDDDKRKIASVLKEWAKLIKPAGRAKQKQKFDPRSLTLPRDLIMGSFPRMWDNWIEHREEIKKPLTKKAAEMALKKLEQIGSTRAVAALQHSISNGWQGIFEPNEKPSGASGGRNRDAFDEVFGNE